MDILSYQILFFCLILASSIFGRSARNKVCIGSIIFTIIMVFTNGLMILQLFTIVIGFFVSEYLIEKLKGKGGIIALICFIIFLGSIIISNFIDKPQNENEINNETSVDIEESNTLNEFDNSIDLDTIVNNSYDEDNVSQLDNGLGFNDESEIDELAIERVGIIHNYILSENDRDLNFIYNSLNTILINFWDKKFLSNDEVISLYKKTWNKYPNAYTDLIAIRNHPSKPSIYLVDVKFYFGDKEVFNTITFQFNEQNKIFSIK